MKLDIFQYVLYDFIPQNRNNIYGVILDGNWSSASTFDWLQTHLDEVIDYLKMQHLPVIIIGQSNIYTIPFASVAAKNFEFNTDNSSFYLNKKSTQINDFMKVKYASMYLDIFYSTAIPKLTENNTPYMYDQNHFTRDGADSVVRRIMASGKGSDFFNK